MKSNGKLKHSRIVFLCGSHLAFDRQAFSVRTLRCTTHRTVHMVDTCGSHAKYIPAACCYIFYYVKLVSIGECAIVIILIYLFCTPVWYFDFDVLLYGRRENIWEAALCLVRHHCRSVSWYILVLPTKAHEASLVACRNYRLAQVVLGAAVGRQSANHIARRLTTTHRNTTISICV